MERAILLCVFTLFTVALAQTPDWWRPIQRAKKYRAGEPSFIYTHGNNHWNQAWYSVQDRHSFIFSVKACGSVRLALTTYIGVTDYSVEILLGEENNTMSYMRYPFAAGNLAVTNTPELLHCHEYRTFWVQWHFDFIEIGRGPSMAEQKIMNWFDRSLHIINAISLTSGDNVAAAWKINANSGDLIDIITSDEYKYTTFWKSVRDRKMYSFKVRACADVHVLLTEQFGRQDGSLYEFVIGGWSNNQSVIRTNMFGGEESVKARQVTPGIVSCYEHREFWIGWYNGTISVGRGDIHGMHRFMSYNDPNPIDVRYLSITTGFGSDGSWILDDDEETVNMIHTPHGNSTPPEKIFNTTFVHMPGERYFQFFVKTSGEARILLADDTETVDEDNDVVITIGSDGQSKLCVGYLFTPGCLAELQQDNLVNSDQYSPYWINWANHTLSVGKGFFYGENPLISNVAISPSVYFTAVALATTNGWGRWKFRKYMGERVSYKTPPEFSYNVDFHSWRSYITKQWFMFYFKGKSDCHVTLSSTFGIDADMTYYDVIIGGWSNTQSAIMELYNMNHRKHVSPLFDTPGLLSDQRNTELWISWYNGFVEAGTGTLVGDEVFLYHNFEDVLDVRAVTFQTGWGSPGEFFFYEDMGDYMTFYTNGSKNTKGWKADQHLLMDAGVLFVTFWVKACKDASVFISSRQGEQQYDHYEVKIGAEDNTKVIIYHEGNQVADVEKHAVLDCNTNKQFWLSWYNSKIELGSSYIYGRYKIIETPDPLATNLSIVGFASTEGAEARWQVQQAFGFNFEMYTTVDYKFVNWFSVEHKDYLYFGVKACSDVHILLSEKIGFQNGFSYEIVLGGWANSRSVIREHLNDEHGQRLPEYVVADTPNILNCTAYELYYLAWSNGAILLGKGLLFDGFSHKLLDYHPVNPRTVRAVAFSTGYGHEGYFDVGLLNEIVAPLIPIVTPGPGGPDNGGGSGSLSGGAIAGIVIGVLSIVCLVGALVFLIMITRGTVRTPESLQTPVEGSGFSNPAAERENPPEDHSQA